MRRERPWKLLTEEIKIVSTFDNYSATYLADTLFKTSATPMVGVSHGKESVADPVESPKGISDVAATYLLKCTQM